MGLPLNPNVAYNSSSVVHCTCAFLLLTLLVLLDNLPSEYSPVLRFNTAKARGFFYLGNIRSPTWLLYLFHEF